MKQNNQIKTLEDQHEAFLKNEMKWEQDGRINGATLAQRKRQRAALVVTA